MQIFKNVQLNGWSCSPKHGPNHFTVFNKFFIWMLWSFSKKRKSMAGPCSPKHGKVLVTVLRNLFVWMLCSHFKNIQVDGWAALPNITCHGPAHFAALKNLLVLVLKTLSTTFKRTAGRASPNTVQLISRSWNNFLSGWYETFQKHSKYGWIVLFQTWSSSYHGVQELLRLDVMQPFQKHSSWWLGLVLRGFEESCRFDDMQTFTKIKVNGWSSCPKHGPVHITVLNKFFVWMLWKSSKTRKTMTGPCSPKHGPVPITVFRNLFGWMLCNHLKTFKLMAGPRSPTSPVTTQLILRCWKIVLFWCNADFQQRSNERLVVLPQTRFSSYHGVENTFNSMVWNFSKTCKSMARPCSLKHRPVRFTILKKLFVWLLCSHLKTIKLIAGPRSPTSFVTAHLISRR